MAEEKNQKTHKKAAPTTDAKKPSKKYSNPFSFTDPLQEKFVNCIMKNGKKAVAQRIVRDMFDEINRKGQTDVLRVFEKALQNATPSMEVKAKRIGGAVYQIPIEVTPKRQQSLSIRWILEGARKRKGQPIYRKLAAEIIDASAETGHAFTKKEDSHRMAQSNKAFAHLARY